LTLVTDSPSQLAAAVKEKFGLPAEVVDGDVRLQVADAARWVAPLRDSFADDIQTVTLGKPTLEDVFIARTGHRFWDAPRPDAA
jgi:ABC-2 type transport system ATP-binding protein